GLSRRPMLSRHGVEPVRPFIGVAILGGLAFFREPVGALPPELFAEHGASRLEAVVERRAAQRPSGAIFLRRPGHGVVFRVGFQRPRTDPAGIDMVAPEPPN